MKEFKFRRWDDINKKFIPCDNLKVGQLGNPLFPFITQYAGLKDKNGKEIYKDDIIEYRYYKGFSGIEKVVIAKVEFKDGCFGFYEFQDGDDAYFNRDDLEDCVIIGNINANPGLLGETNSEK